MKAAVPCLLLAAIALLLPGASPAEASSHREAPLIAEDPLADNTDVYAFVSPADPTKVTLIANYIPLQAPYGGPNFFRFGDDVLYEIHVDNDGDARPDISFQFRFRTLTRNPNTFLYTTGQVTSLGDADLNRPQLYTLRMARPPRFPRIPFVPSRILGSNLPAAPSNVGPKSMPDYPSLRMQAVHDLGDGVSAFAGQSEEGFYVDLGGTFDILNIRSPGKDQLAGFNVNTIAIEVPKQMITRDGTAPTNPAADAAVIGVWATASRPRTTVLTSEGEKFGSSDFVQVSRLGSPLVNEVVIPVGLKDRFNSSEPRHDAQFLRYVLDPELGRLFEAGALSLNGSTVPLDVPDAPRRDLVAIFLTGIPGLNQPPGVVPSEMLRLNVAIPPAEQPSRLGVLGGDVAGYPNGRRVMDDVVDIAIRAVAGATPLTPDFDVSPNNILGDFVDTNDTSFLTVFPYLANPTDGFTAD